MEFPGSGMGFHSLEMSLNFLTIFLDDSLALPGVDNS